MLDADVEDVAILMPDKKSPTYLPFILVGTSVLASTAALGLACASFVAFNERNEHITPNFTGSDDRGPDHFYHLYFVHDVAPFHHISGKSSAPGARI